MQLPKNTVLAFVCLVLLSGTGACQAPRPASPPVIPPAFPGEWTIIDLTRPLDWRAPYVPHPRAFPFERIVFETPKGSNWSQAGFTALEQMGTHIAAPRARRPEGATADQLAARESILPLVVVDAPADIAGGAVPVATLHAHELEHGLIPAGALVVLRTGLGSAAPDDPRYGGRNDARELTFPGWSAEAAAFLISVRHVRAIGTDAPAVDPSSAVKTAPAQTAAALEGLFCVAGLGDLSTVPRTGSHAVIGALPIVGGSGAPCRVLALVPPAPPERPESKDPAE